MLEADIKVVAGFLHRAVQLALLLQKESNSKLLKDFVHVASVETPGLVGAAEVKQLRREVKDFASRWPLPGVDVTNLTKPSGIEED
jgi:glycine hydroxymethyltransferase